MKSDDELSFHMTIHKKELCKKSITYAPSKFYVSMGGALRLSSHTLQWLIEAVQAAGGWLVSCLTVNKNLHMHITFDIHEDSYVCNHLLYLQMTFKITMDYFFLEFTQPASCLLLDAVIQAS